jgi:hypothetical protein
MKYALFLTLFLVLQNPSPSRGIASQDQQTHTSNSKQQPQGDQRGTENNPLFVKQLPTPKTDEEAAQEAADRNEKTASDRSIVKLTFWLVIATFILAAVGILQLGVFGYQARKLRQTVDEMRRTGEQTDKLIGEAITQSKEAANLARAMENTAAAIQTSTKIATTSVEIGTARSAQQLRAYVCVEVGTAFYQNRTNGIKFGGQVNMLNTGHTPAHKVRFNARVDILPFPLPNNQPLPLPNKPAGGTVLGPAQKMFITRFMDDFVPGADVDAIKLISAGKALYMWGVIYYEDVLQQEYTTDFCLALYWLPDGKTVLGQYADRHNDAT